MLPVHAAGSIEAPRPCFLRHPRAPGAVRPNIRFTIRRTVLSTDRL